MKMFRLLMTVTHADEDVIVTFKKGAASGLTRR